ncbi:MAG: DNA helicase RecQ [Zoogloeaceae bacterium]|jgi:ATP-dependent DNA helicase RecQ|nr:DNA helicase RecQ [Zoogloeaceae bacterium]
MQPLPSSSLSTTPSAALEVLRHTFGYPAFRGQQAEVIEHVAAGGDALVLMPTGGGKSLCYQIPALLRRGVAVVVSPLIALMQDQVDALTQLGIRAALLNSTVAWSAVRETEQKLFSGQVDLLYVAPERLMTDRFLAILDGLAEGGRLALFAIDEAHCVSQWGHDFRPEYLQLSALHERHPNVPRIALTATADEATRQEMIARLGLAAARVFIASFDRPNIRYTVVEKDNPRRQLLNFLAARRGEAGIVYCLSRKKVEETAAWLNIKGYSALPYHAGMETAARTQNQRRFLREEGIIMVATIAFGMGIDKPDVRFVAHLDLPKSLEAYYQETGRAGRDGEAAEAWMTYGLQDVALQRSRIEDSTADETQKRLETQKLNALLGYAESARCRRVALLHYFGEASEPCGNCDACLDPPQCWDGTIAAQKALSAAYRTGQRFGAKHLIDVLRGKENTKTQEYGHQRLTTWGIGADMDEVDWRSVFRQLVSAGFLHVDMNAYGALKLTALSRPVLKGEQSVELRRAASHAKSARLRETRRATLLADLPPEAQRLFERLRQWRAETAKEQGVPAYVIFHDRTLKEIAERHPHTPATLVEVQGVGQAKMERYGEKILELAGEGKTFAVPSP